MKTLNLANPEQSDIKYKKILFPDGQQNIVIDSKFEGLKCVHYKGHLPTQFLVPEPFIIKSRLNNWLDLELITCAVASLKELGVEEIHLYTPYIMGARSDRKFEEGGNHYLRDVICPIINSLNFKSVICIDPHSDVLEACIKGFRKESNLQVVQGFFENNCIKDYILVSPDAGASKKIHKLAEQIGYKGDIITCSKDRDKDGKLTQTFIPFDYHDDIDDKDLIIIDDICDGGATFINIAKKFKDSGYKNKIYLIVTHSIFSKGTDELLKYFDEIYTTNSYKENNVEKVKVLNVF